MKWRLSVAPRVHEQLPSLHPVIKRYVKEAFEAISQDPWAGKPLRDELEGLHSFRARRFRVVYQIQRGARAVMVVGVGPRETIYEELAGQIHGKGVG